ncbi:uncharacterized protein LOC123872803 [Maniola jurtina]|uniref:uncharacterized protein LOC123872803 n=1 Tax=Maniola jurtina TaxID=191418 RepID=UPI001E68D83A|nr:uncharacterized protein LOC123872803 [Maniola jurtina]
MDDSKTGKELDPSLLPIEQVFIGEDDVSDLRDVVDAINKLCETMKTSYDEYEDCEDVQDTENLNAELDPSTTIVEDVIAEYWSEMELEVSSPEHVMAKPVPRKVETCIDTSYTAAEPVFSSPEVVAEPVIFETCKRDRLRDTVAEVIPTPEQAVEPIPQSVEEYKDSWSETVVEPVMIASEPIFEKVRSYKSERSDTIEPEKPAAAKTDMELFRPIVTEKFEEVTSDVETVQCEPMSEMYYTASSEVSLLSDVDFQEKAHTEDSDKEKDDRTGVMAGHVAAMRERFESMTRTNTPCPDLMRSMSPSFEVFRNFSSSPDPLE